MAAFRRSWLGLLAVAALVAGTALGVGLAPTDAAAPGTDAPAFERTDLERGGSVAYGEASNGSTLGPPDWPAEPLDPGDVPGRAEVVNASAYPNSAIGHVGASGVLVSDYHVLTAAHVVTDDEGRPIDADRLTFTPGLRAVPGDRASVPFGRADVESIHVHPDWAGDPPEQDLALLVLDRPVGTVAGSMALDPDAAERPSEHVLRQAGYPENVSGARMVASRPDARPERTAANPGYQHYCAPVSTGDSGSPIWTYVDGTPTVLSVNADWDGGASCADGAVGVRMDADRVATVERWMARDDRPAAKADLVVASEAAGPHWIDASDLLPNEPVARNGSFAVGATLYNNGPTTIGNPSVDDGGGPVSVAFTARATRRANGSDGSQVTATTELLCTANVSVGAYGTADAACAVDDLPGSLQDAAQLTIHATVDPGDDVAEYETSPLRASDGPQYVGHVDLAP